ncbi:hypothetical protein [Treponema pedis]|uniref:Uncharacterized protein n=3 Tax=Treponema pedis TaxID=409322 RepID=S6A124_9SPIR|nr:hypothetical protein [Treponema pedis]AGT44463.1 hypothetical protein TPE_1989 [Treponema pedis str. T A4]QOW59776.1 hypothetical protein IFE08_07790 [Treponema pedis]QSI05148.1 hypothetical protein DYQ05_09600 [Treponema pedis]
MLHKIIFQDNLFQITRMLDTVRDGMRLDLAQDIFSKKFIHDILFFDSALQKLFNQIEPQSHLPDYMDSMHCLYFCMAKYINLLQVILTEKKAAEFLNGCDIENLENIWKTHKDLIDKINIDVDDTEVHSESYNMVSQNELSELFNFN